MKEHFDFLLFENSHSAFNHKYDLVLIAKLLRHAGLKVGIVDVYHEDSEDEMEGIPIVHLHFYGEIPNGNKRNILHSHTLTFLWEQYFYMKHVWREIEPLADRFYFGSYHLMMPMNFLKSKKPCYYWGLRSYRMTNFWMHFRMNMLYGIRMLLLKKAFMRNPNQCLFVSNPIIKKEFESLGIASKRLVIREERCSTGKEEPHYDLMTNNFSLLTIGKLRKEKRIDYTVKEFFDVNESKDWTYVLAGHADGFYEPTIEKAIRGQSNIIRINEYMDYDHFYKLIKECHFVLLADKPQPSSVTNGTMLEAFLNYRPIIAPNYNPYKYYIEKYGVGVMFNPDKPGDLARAMKEADRLGAKHFEDNIRRYLSTIEYGNVSQFLYKQIYGNK